MTELVARTVTSVACLATVVVLALADVIDGELVYFVLGALLPSPVTAAARPLTTKPATKVRKAPG